MSEEEQVQAPLVHPAEGFERRAASRETLWRRMLDLHYTLRRDHNSLAKEHTSLSREVSILATSVHQLVDNQRDNHEDQMAVLTRIDLGIIRRSYGQAVGIAALLGVLGYILIKIWTM